MHTGRWISNYVNDDSLRVCLVEEGSGKGIIGLWRSITAFALRYSVNYGLSFSDNLICGGISYGSRETGCKVSYKHSRSRTVVIEEVCILKRYNPSRQSRRLINVK
jgi:hypothetical protein